MMGTPPYIAPPFIPDPFQSTLVRDPPFLSPHKSRDFKAKFRRYAAKFIPVTICCAAHTDVPYFFANARRLSFLTILSFLTSCNSLLLRVRSGGRPSRTPFLRAFWIPIRTRSVISDLSNSL